MKFKKGDKVRVTELGRPDSIWVDSMDNYIGTVQEISFIDEEGGIYLKDISYTFPLVCLEKINDYTYKVGDEVYCLINGWGKVEKVRDEIYAITVRFKESTFYYTKEGKPYEVALQPTLYFEEITLPKVKPPVRFKKGDVVLVSDNGSQFSFIRLFHSFEDGFIVSEDSGFHPDCLEKWDNCKPYKP